MTPDEFATKIKAKYPVYQSVDNIELAKKIVEKYPQYASQVKFDTAPAFTAPKPTIVANKSGTGLPDTTTGGSTQAIPDSTTPSTLDVLGNTAKSLVSGTVEAGKDLGAAIAAPQVQEALTKIDEADQKGLAGIIQLRNTAKTAGKDTTHYDNLIKNYQLSNNETVADIFPALKKSNEQVIGDFGSLFLEALGGSSGLAGAAKKVAGTAEGVSTASRIAKGAAEGSAYGAGFGATGAMQNNESGTGIAKSVVEGAAAGAVIGGAAGGALGKRSPEEIAARQTKIAADNAKNFDRLTGTIVQGKPEDIAKAQKALSNIDVSGIKTYKDLNDTLDEKIADLSGKLDKTLETNTGSTKLKDLTLTSKVGDQKVSHNYIKDAIDQLKAHFSKINDPEGVAKMEQLASKAKTEGLNVKDLNDLARLHGRTINAFNANGEAASGLTKQAAENTRSGIKSTARSLFGDPVYNATDAEITNLIRTRDLTDAVATKVNQLQQRVQERGLGEKAGRLVFQIVDKFTGGGLKGFIQSFIPRGEGLKVMNALDLESGLKKNLKQLQGIIDSEGSAAEVEKQLEAYISGKGTVQKPSKPLQNYKSVKGAMNARKKGI